MATSLFNSELDRIYITKICSAYAKLLGNVDLIQHTDEYYKYTRKYDINDKKIKRKACSNFW